MPELPEVETTCNGIRPNIENQIISKVVVRQPQLRWLIPDTLSRDIKNSKIISIERRAKYILINLLKETKKTNKNSKDIKSKNYYLIIHLGMSGKLCLYDITKQPQKHDHVDFVLSNNLVLRYTDPRRFGCILYTSNDPKEHKLISHLGLEPLSSSFNSNYLIEKSANKITRIKQFIMDAKIVVGVGNIYANEALFMSKINPHRKAKGLSMEEIKLLVKNIKLVLRKAIKKGGTTLKDFMHSDGKAGYFAQQLLVYGRDGESCNVCSDKIVKDTIGQRSTFYCDTCQE